MPDAGLTIEMQQDFSAGMIRSVAPHLIPANGAYDMQNLLLSPEGSPFKRGGSVYKTNAAFGTSMRFVWDGYLAAGQRTVFASPAKFGVLDVDDATAIDTGGAGLTNPVRPAVLNGVMYLPGGLAYGGSRKSASYSTGTVSVTNGSRTVTGSGTTWSSNLDAGMLLRVNAAGDLYAIASVDSNTQVTLAVEYNGTTASGQTYAATVQQAVPSPYRSASLYAVAGNRLVTGEGNRVYFSAIRNPSSFAATDYHELPTGVQIVGLDSIQGVLLIYTTRGVWGVRNIALNLTDAYGNVQQSLTRLNGDVVCWGNSGIATYSNALVVPTIDGCWLMDGTSTPVNVGQSIAPLIQSYVAAGYVPGLATVHNNHYFLPVLDGSVTPIDLLVCRLDRPTKQGFPWTRWAGAAANVTALANRSTATAPKPVLFGAYQPAGRVLQYDPLTPDVTHSTDADNSSPSWKIITRDLPTNGSTKWLTKKARVRYEQVAPMGQSPTIQLAFGTGTRPPGAAWGTAVWGTSVWTDPTDAGFQTATGDAPTDSGGSPFSWPLNQRARFMRLRLGSTGQTSRMVLRSLELFVRPSGRQ